MDHWGVAQPGANGFLAITLVATGSQPARAIMNLPYLERRRLKSRRSL